MTAQQICDASHLATLGHQAELTILPFQTAISTSHTWRPGFSKLLLNSSNTDEGLLQAKPTQKGIYSVSSCADLPDTNPCYSGTDQQDAIEVETLVTNEVQEQQILYSIKALCDLRFGLTWKLNAFAPPPLRYGPSTRSITGIITALNTQKIHHKLQHTYSWRLASPSE